MLPEVYSTQLRRFLMIGNCLQTMFAANNPIDMTKIKTEKPSASGEEFLQNIARLMDDCGVSSIDELIKTVDEGGPDPKRRR